MGRKREAIKPKLINNDYVVNRESQQIDFKEIKATSVSDASELIIRNSKGTAGKTTLGEILRPLKEDLDTLKEDVSVLAQGPTKCFTIAMSIALG